MSRWLVAVMAAQCPLWAGWMGTSLYRGQSGSDWLESAWLWLAEITQGFDPDSDWLEAFWLWSSVPLYKLVHKYPAQYSSSTHISNRSWMDIGIASFLSSRGPFLRLQPVSCFWGPYHWIATGLPASCCFNEQLALQRPVLHAHHCSPALSALVFDILFNWFGASFVNKKSAYKCLNF